MALFKVDMEKCVLCGACVNVCPSRIIVIKGKEGPQKSIGKSCIACGHCVSVCPVGAMDNRKSPLKEQVDLSNWQRPSAEEMTKILRSRRSIRSYLEKEVPEEKITEILDLARHAPTGGNTQNISFIIHRNKELLKKISKSVINWMQLMIEKAEPEADYYKSIVKSSKTNDHDWILRDAPAIAVAIAPKNFTRAFNNCAYVWAYAELFAPSLGLGTCIAGFAHRCAQTEYRELIELLDIPEDYQVAGILMIGYPKYKYKRLVPRQPLKITFK